MDGVKNKHREELVKACSESSAINSSEPNIMYFKHWIWHLYEY